MDYEDMVHKMVPMHLDYYRRMLGVNEVPEPVMLRYFSLKKYTDKLSAPLSVMDLLRIAMDVGFNLETGKFAEPEIRHCITRPILGRELEGINSDEAEVTVIGKPMSSAAVQDFVDEIIEDEDVGDINEVLDKLVGGEDALDSEETGIDPNEKTALAVNIPIENDTEVSFYLDGDVVKGIVKGSSAEGATDEITYKVEVDGEVVEISEDDIE
jgi:hypothetical protein